MSPRSQALVVTVLVTVLAVAAVAGSSRMSGPVVWTFTATHGVHVEDLFVAAAWAACMAWCWRQWRRGR